MAEEPGKPRCRKQKPQPSSDPHIESFDGADLSGLTQEVPDSDRTSEGEVGGRTEVSCPRKTRSPGQAPEPAWAGLGAGRGRRGRGGPAAAGDAEAVLRSGPGNRAARDAGRNNRGKPSPLRRLPPAQPCMRPFLRFRAAARLCVRSFEFHPRAVAASSTRRSPPGDLAPSRRIRAEHSVRPTDAPSPRRADRAGFSPGRSGR